MKYVLIIVGTLLTVFVGLFLFFMVSLPDLEPTYRKITITGEKSSSRLYIKSKNWGVTDDSQITVISTDAEQKFEGDSTKEFVYHGLEPFLYKLGIDTLFVYTRKQAQIPQDFKSKWTIEQFEVDNPEMMTLMSNPEFKRF